MFEPLDKQILRTLLCLLAASNLSLVSLRSRSVEFAFKLLPTLVKTNYEFILIFLAPINCLFFVICNAIKAITKYFFFLFIAFNCKTKITRSCDQV